LAGHEARRGILGIVRIIHEKSFACEMCRIELYEAELNFQGLLRPKLLVYSVSI
jgi:hypothetical protein